MLVFITQASIEEGKQVSCFEVSHRVIHCFLVEDIQGEETTLSDSSMLIFRSLIQYLDYEVYIRIVDIGKCKCSHNTFPKLVIVLWFVL